MPEDTLYNLLTTRQGQIEYAREDPNFFMDLVCGKVQANPHRQMQDFWSAHDNCYIEAHRGLGKTVQISGRCAWEIGHDPSVRIKYLQQNEKESKKSVSAIRHLLETPIYREIFPNIHKTEIWGAEAFTVQNEDGSRDPTVEACGILGRAGGRFDILIPDDICDMKNAIQQPSLRGQVKNFYKSNWLPMRDFSKKRPPRTWCIGTCWHVDDITADWRKYHVPRGTLLRLPVIGTDGAWVSPWGEVLTSEILNEAREEFGKLSFTRAYLLKPLSSDMFVFPGEQLESAFYQVMPDDVEIAGTWIAAFDWAYTEKRMKNNPDWSVCLIGKKHPFNGNVYVEDMVRGQWSFPEFKRRAIKRCEHYGVKYGIGEANGPQEGICDEFNEDSPFPLLKEKRVTDKHVRATEKQPHVECGKFKIKAQRGEYGVMEPIPELAELFAEMSTFPSSGHDDTVDAALDLLELASQSTGMSVPQTVTRPSRLTKAGGIYG